MKCTWIGALYEVSLYLVTEVKPDSEVLCFFWGGGGGEGLKEDQNVQKKN
jgi:hypothetical protein